MNKKIDSGKKRNVQIRIKGTGKFLVRTEQLGAGILIIEKGGAGDERKEAPSLLSSWPGRF